MATAVAAAGIALLLQAEAAARSGDTVAVRVLLDRVEPGLVVIRGWRARVEACRVASDPRCAAAEAARARDQAPDAGIRAAASTRLGAMLLQRSDTAGAMAAFRVSIVASPASDAGLEAGRLLAALRTPTPEDRLAPGRLFFRHGLTDPAVNIRLGTLFVAELLDRHGGNAVFALAAYNAGPSRVTRWRRLADNAEPDGFAERIPFPETRDYVHTVQQSARIHAELYGPAATGN